jgi:phage replication-related protein YjqB (UPF0714/DUF867 family)
MPTEYSAQILKLRLPEQDELKNETERCSADPVMLESIGRSIGQQVRVKRSGDSRFVALYTVKQANPDADLSDPGRANVVRIGLTGRERLGTSDEMEAVVQAKVVATPQPGEPGFFEVADDDGKQAYFIAIAPHGGDIEEHTDEQAADAVRELTTAGFQASLWFCKGDGDQAKGAFDRWHITSTDIHPACFPLLQRLMSRTFCYGVAFHGFQRKEDESDVYIGGAASQSLKIVIERALNNLDLPIKVKISTYDDNLKFQGFSPENLINRLAASGIHLEQSLEARKKFHGEIACAVAKVFASRWRVLVCILIEDLKKKRADAEATWRAKDEALAVKIKAAEEVRTFIEDRIEE